MFRTYYQLTKPGIIYGNLISCAAGFFFASKGNINWELFLFTQLGTALVIGSACVFNNWPDRDIDSKMQRTKNRALVKGTVAVGNAIIFASVLGLLGTLILIFFVNTLTFLIGFLGFFFYVFLYTPIKRHSVYGTLVGSVSGATPPVAGYVAVTNSFDTAALLLFIVLTTWQMPHFYSIAIFRLKDYMNAKIPVLPVKKGINFTKKTMTGYVILFLFAVLVLNLTGYTGNTYLVTMSIISIAWLALTVKGFKTKNNEAWARKMFRFSLIVLLVFCLSISLEVVLP